MKDDMSLEAIADGKYFVLKVGSGTVILSPRQRDRALELLEQTRTLLKKTANGKSHVLPEPAPLRRAAGGRRR